ncbi:sugar phosphate nucleotidyltransferase [Roseibium salinum]|nr:sugar phosphate nucleotidyltransferase [Roseibium salinum]
MSGGVGSRLWPLSRTDRPKQFLPIFGGESLFFQKNLQAGRPSRLCRTHNHREQQSPLPHRRTIGRAGS